MSEAVSMDVTLPLGIDLAPAAPSVDAARLDRAVLENGRLQAIVDALPDARYSAALALGAPAGLARRLKIRCANVQQLSAVATAGVWPESAEGFDLVVISDLLVGADKSEMAFLTRRLSSVLKPGGHVVLAHWLDDRGADEAAAAFVQSAGARYAPVSRQRTPHYRLDVLEFDA